MQLVALTDITFTELTRISNGPGSPEDKQRAMAVLVTQLVVTGGLTALSVQGARNVRAFAGKPLEIVDQNGRSVLRVVGEDTSASSESKPMSRGDAGLEPSAAKDLPAGNRARDGARAPNGQPDTPTLGRTVASHPVELLGESHTLRIVERGHGAFSLALCSNCGFVRAEIDAVLAETSASGPTKSLGSVSSAYVPRLWTSRPRWHLARPSRPTASPSWTRSPPILRICQRSSQARTSCACSARSKASSTTIRWRRISASNAQVPDPTASRSTGVANEFISPDVDRHNGGIWKKATGDATNLRNKATRDGTFNEDLTEMVGP